MKVHVYVLDSCSTSNVVYAIRITALDARICAKQQGCLTISSWGALLVNVLKLGDSTWFVHRLDSR
jgi:hypothetical protein